MKERPILFSGSMVRAILAGKKTQTRRIVKPRKDRFVGCELAPNEIAGEVNGGDYTNSPYMPGDRLWVRETTRSYYLKNFLTGEPTNALCGQYVADGEQVLNEHGFDIGWWYSRKTCPAIHMPCWASRITLEVTSVRVERLQDISAADARAEGISDFVGGWWCEHDDAEQIAGMTPEDGYKHLWERINGPGSWDANPWVWVLEFKRVAP